MYNYTPVTVYPVKESDDWMNLTGELPVKMTNDYLFRALLQSDNRALRALLASLLHMDYEEVTSAEITNPILLGEALGDKTFILDVKVEMLERGIIDLEMQVVRTPGWTERSVSYICRSFDQLNHGMVYMEAKPVHQIAFCDFTLFKDYPEFFSTYKLMNVREPGRIYTDKLIISNVDLTRPDLATEDDIKYGLHTWAGFFKAKTWEDMKMLAKENKTISGAVSAIHMMTEDEMIREQCRAREEWIANNKWMQDKIAEQADQLAQKDDQLAQKDDQLSQQEEVIARLRKEIEILRIEAKNN